MNIAHPTKQVIPIEQALAEWRGVGNCVWQQKLDGRFTVLPVAGGVLAGETVGDKFTAFDCIEYQGADARATELRYRLEMRDYLCRAAGLPVVESVARDGGEFLARVLAAGGEGVVCKALSASFYEPMVAAKRAQIYVCRVTEAAGTRQSVRICNAATGQDYGRVPARGGAADVLRVGNAVRVEAFGETGAGKLREARLCREYLVNQF